MATETYHVRVEKESLVFSAAHFITLGGNICERLHGHNYGVAAELAGPLDENHYVVDFIFVRDALFEITRELDHRVLLPTEHDEIKLEQTSTEVTARFQDRRWVFPRQDCALLPIANTTAELLATFIAHRLLDRFTTEKMPSPASLSIAVDENRGQWGVYNIREPYKGIGGRSGRS